MNKISVQSNEITFVNPFILASSPISRNAEMIMRAFKAGWGGAVTKTINLTPDSINNATPRMYGLKNKSNIIGLNNIELISERPFSKWLEEIELIKNTYPERIIIASIMAEAFNYEAWQELTEKLQNKGADIIELNLSCPNGMPERKMGSFLSEVPDISANIVKNVKKVSTIPIWAKLSPNITDISNLAHTCLKAGADGIVAINTVKGFSGININTLKPKLNVNEKSMYGGFSGKMVKPIALKAISEISIENNNCIISGSGGISSWQDAVEFLLLGSSTLQICTEVMFNGFDIIKDLNSGLENYISTHNLSSVEELIGLSLKTISSFENLDKSTKNFASIDKNKCVNCGKCFISCKDGAYQAIEKTNEKFTVNNEKCTGCGLCTIVCPVSCIEMKTL